MQRAAQEPAVRPGFLARSLDPVDRLTESISTVLVVMTFTMAFRATDASASDPSPMGNPITRLALASFGCAIAWGIIDAALHVLTRLLRRHERNRVQRLVQSAPTEDAAIRVIAAELDEMLELIAADEERQRLYRHAYERLRVSQPRRVGMKRQDFSAAAAVVGVTLVTSLPLVVPLVLLRDQAWLAPRVSNLMAIAMLFYFGHRWGRYSGSHPIKTGLLLAFFGLALVAIAIPLGG